MIGEESAQVSLEYLLIFTVSLIVLMVFTLPLAEQSVEMALDVSDSLNVKSDISRISQAISEVYGEGQGSMHTVGISSNKKIKITITNSYVSCNLKLKNNKNKQIKQYISSNIKKTSITLHKGDNALVVQWPMGSENIIVYRK